VLELAAKNFEANEGAFKPDLSTKLVQLRWGSNRDELDEAGIRPPYDAIFGADLVRDTCYPFGWSKFPRSSLSLRIPLL
jgi:hypothetical protein